MGRRVVGLFQNRTSVQLDRTFRVTYRGLDDGKVVERRHVGGIDRESETIVRFCRFERSVGLIDDAEVVVRELVVRIVRSGPRGMRPKRSIGPPQRGHPIPSAGRRRPALLRTPRRCRSRSNRHPRIAPVRRPGWPRRASDAHGVRLSSPQSSWRIPQVPRSREDATIDRRASYMSSCRGDLPAGSCDIGTPRARGPGDPRDAAV